LKTVPRRLKPSRDQGFYGTAEAVPFVERSFPIGNVKCKTEPS
jgi:hypothetical protein